jgi:membrane associated rhomboid family serine protease
MNPTKEPNKWNEKRHLFHSLVFPLFFLFLMFSVRLIESVELENWYWLGIRPLSLEGMLGIITMPFVHAGWSHFLNNAPSFLILAVCLFYFYRPIGYKVFFTIYLLSGIWLWILARDSWHVGASGLIYGLASFLFTSGIQRRHIPLMAISLLVVFQYGSMVWGIFPTHQFDTYSWEGHYWGTLAGLVAAFLYKNEGPQRPKPIWEEPEEPDGENPYWKQNPEETP